MTLVRLEPAALRSRVKHSATALHSPSYGVYISQLICFARVCSNVDDLNNRNKFLTSKLSNKVIDTINFLKPLLNFIADTQI